MKPRINKENKLTIELNEKEYETICSLLLKTKWSKNTGKKTNDNMIITRICFTEEEIKIAEQMYEDTINK